MLVQIVYRPLNAKEHEDVGAVQAHYFAEEVKRCTKISYDWYSHFRDKLKRGLKKKEEVVSIRSSKEPAH